MQPSTAAIVVIAGAFLVDCAWLVWEKRQTKEESYQGYTGPVGFIPRHHEQPRSVTEFIEQLAMNRCVKINVNLNVVGWPITGTIECECIPCPPSAPVVGSITFKKGLPPMAQRTGSNIVITSPVDPSVTSIPVVITGSTVAGQNPVTIDAFVVPQATFQCNDGDILIPVATQVNSAGPSPPSAAGYVIVVAGTVPVIAGTPPPPVVVPLAPTVGSITFA